jgi:hypothetical protein
MVYEAVEQSVEEVHKYITWDNLTRGRQPPVQVDVLRDLFADRFRPVVLRPGWLTPTVLALAAGVYDDHAFDRLPILADALEEAGCDNRDVLDHCRGPGPHARGCWVVDLVLGKG